MAIKNKLRHMKKILRIILLSIIGAFIIGAFIIINFYSNVDDSAYCRAETLHWDDKTYTIIAKKSYYEEGINIIKTSDGYDINEVVGDPSHTFVVVRSFLDDALYVRDDYKIPTSGKLSFVYWNRIKVSDELFLKTVQDILKNAKTDFEYDTEAIFVLSDKQRMEPLYFAYEDSPVATYIAYMGVVSGKWVITTNISKDLKHVSVSIIPKEKAKILSPYLIN